MFKMMKNKEEKIWNDYTRKIRVVQMTSEEIAKISKDPDFCDFVCGCSPIFQGEDLYNRLIEESSKDA